MITFVSYRKYYTKCIKKRLSVQCCGGYVHFFYIECMVKTYINVEKCMYGKGKDDKKDSFSSIWVIPW